MDVYLEDRIKIGISACMYGCKFRYNAKGWHQLEAIGRDASSFIWFPVCPEVNAGFGVPREAIKITGESGSAVWKNAGKVMSGSGKNLTSALMKSSEACLNQLLQAEVAVFIYMEGSPSCGVYRTTLKNKRLGKPPGVFGHLLLENGFFLIPANDLTSPVKWWDWRRRMLAFLWLKKQPLHTMADLYGIWHVLKFLCQEIDEKWARALGKKFADMAHPKAEDLEAIRVDILNVLRKPSSPQKIKNRLWKHYSHYRKLTGKTIEGIKRPTELRNMTELAEELLKMELGAMSVDYLFGASPIINRKKKAKE
ncbi:2-thiouracil desulfurase family protein [Fusibacter ferrireducens]|uniref:DUF523 domain-containing protein n=1 Tax=Fusibacter ferrireducens TaxID=2785058 RepID=A0ABR9ZQG8_9FIRM|nr:DUF523 domain-containing protein [Fusibacter ferrireducens]MBF4692710.1 DUF523 domain-containing protein [Fusibacter ferrireducens]